MKGNPKISEVGKGTRFPINDPTKGGRKKSLKKVLEKLLDNDGQMYIESNKVIKIEENGDVIVRLPNSEELMIHLLSISKGNSSNSLRAIQIIMEHLDGKPTQYIEFAEYDNNLTVFIDATGHITQSGLNQDPNLI